MFARYTTVALMMVSTAWPALTYAQQAAPAAATDASSSSSTDQSGNGTGTGNGDIVVTALRRATRLEQTPAAITSLSNDAIQQNNITDLSDLQQVVPGLVATSQGAGLNELSLRGVRSSAGDQLVGLYYDETPLNAPPGTTTAQASAQSDVDFFDISRVEVLRGPQGTLYGAGAAGGAIKLITNKPDLEHLGGTIDLTGSTIDHSAQGYQANGEINIPLIQDKLAVRVVAYRRYTPGYIDNSHLGLNHVNSDAATGGRVLVRYQPVSAVTLDFSAHFGYENGKGDPLWAPSQGLYQSADLVLLKFRDKNRFYNFTGNFDLGFAKLTATTSYQDRNLLQTRDPNPLFARTFNPAIAAAGGHLGTPYALPVEYYQPQDIEDLTSEVRLSSEGNGPFTWTIGGYYEDRHSHLTSDIANVANPSIGYNPNSDTLLFVRHVVDDRIQKAVFGELAYTLFHNLTATGGIRYYDYHNTVGGDRTYSNPAYPANAAFFGALLPFTAYNSRDNGLLYRGNLSWQADHHLLFYFNAASGYRPGGVNQPIGSVTNLPYNPDSVWTYEAGAKASYLGGRLEANVALYRTDWSNMQINLNSGSFSFIGNAGSARLQGLEAELHFEPARGWSFDTALTTSSNKLTSDQIFNVASVVGSASGKAGDRVPNVPDGTVDFSSTYEWGIGNGLKAQVHGNVSYIGNSYSAFNPGTSAAVAGYYKIGDYAVAGARIGVKGPSWSAAVFGSNLFDGKGKISAANTLGGVTETVLTVQPRTIGINLTKSF